LKNDLSCKWTAKYRSVIGFGEIEIITGFEDKKKGLDIIMAHYGIIEANSYDEKNFNGLVILKLGIKEISGKQSGDWGKK
jgi:nitroimidazol reductase NimA-like FMN-containing flavoprotein (pyridoxamine 5'-phosphate oxidase superfamily)